jgi:hypothetical protein
VKERKKMNESKPKVGDFLYSSWGYEQTNVEFYKVIRVSESSVWIQEWESKVVEIVGWASEMVVPGDKPVSFLQHKYVDGQHSDGHADCEQYVAPVECKRWSKYGSVSFSNYKSAWIWEGKPEYASHYA